MSQLRLELEKYIQRVMKNVPGADELVLMFIKNFVTHAAVTEAEYEIIRSTFRAGYCWHFAHLLKTTFNRGEVCLAAPFGHFVWIDNDVPYDIEGIYEGECVHFIPESYLGDTIKDFLHIPGIGHNTSVDEIMSIIHRYEDDNNFPHRDEEIEKFLKP